MSKGRRKQRQLEQQHRREEKEKDERERRKNDRWDEKKAERHQLNNGRLRSQLECLRGVETINDSSVRVNYKDRFVWLEYRMTPGHDLQFATGGTWYGGSGTSPQKALDTATAQAYDVLVRREQEIDGIWGVYPTTHFLSKELDAIFGRKS